MVNFKPHTFIPAALRGFFGGSQQTGNALSDFGVCRAFLWISLNFCALHLLELCLLYVCFCQFIPPAVALGFQIWNRDIFFCHNCRRLLFEIHLHRIERFCPTFCYCDANLFVHTYRLETYRLSVTQG